MHAKHLWKYAHFAILLHRILNCYCGLNGLLVIVTLIILISQRIPEYRSRNSQISKFSADLEVYITQEYGSVDNVCAIFCQKSQLSNALATILPTLFFMHMVANYETNMQKIGNDIFMTAHTWEHV